MFGNGRRAIVLVAVLLSACGETNLRQLRGSGDGPDEFSVAPVLPLAQPADYASLPPPTPGEGNRTDPKPLDDLKIALGGRADDPNAAVPGADGGLVGYVARNGVDPSIRATLADEDAAFRRRKSRFTNIQLFPEDRYDIAYQREALDAHRAARALRGVGIRVPSAPPGRGQ